MPTLYYSPQSRSDTVVALVRMLSADVDLREVTIARQDGSGQRDPANPHPEGKVPYLTDGDDAVRERGAIMLYLTDKYTAAGLGPLAGEPLHLRLQHRRCLSPTRLSGRSCRARPELVGHAGPRQPAAMARRPRLRRHSLCLDRRHHEQVVA